MRLASNKQNKNQAEICKNNCFTALLGLALNFLVMLEMTLVFKCFNLIFICVLKMRKGV